MCELPKRRILGAVRPARFLAAALGVVAIAAGWLVPAAAAAVPMGAGALLIISALVPAIRDIEIGAGDAKVVLPLREQEIKEVFEQQRGDLTLCAHLLAGDAGKAAELLEAAWSRTAGVWRGPVTPALRLYTLCVFVDLLRKYEGTIGHIRPDTPGPLFDLPLVERVAVVLHDFASLTVAEIAGLTESTTAAVTERLHLGNEKVQLALGGGSVGSVQP